LRRPAPRLRSAREDRITPIVDGRCDLMGRTLHSLQATPDRQPRVFHASRHGWLPRRRSHSSYTRIVGRFSPVREVGGLTHISVLSCPPRTDRKSASEVHSIPDDSP